jgi:hypothetical protein
VQSTSTSVLTPDGVGTRLQATLEYSLAAGFFTGLAEQIMGPKTQSDFEQSLQTLKRLLEGQPGS